MSENQDQLQEQPQETERERLEQLISELEQKPSRSQFEENQLRLRKERLEVVKREQTGGQDRKEQQEKQVDAHMEHALLMFEALFPHDDYTRKIGVNEYDEKQQQFNQLFHAALTDITHSIHTQHDQELSLRDAHNKTLFDQLMAAEQHNAELKGQHMAADAQATQLAQENEQLKQQLDQHKSDLAGKELLLQEKQKHIDQLRTDLNNAPAPKQAVDITPTGQSFMDALAAVRETNEQKANRALSGFYERNPHLAPVPIPEVDVAPEPKESPFRDEAKSADTQPQGDQLHSAEAQSVGDQFPEANPVETVQTTSDSTKVVRQEVSGVVTREEFDALKADVDNIKRQVGLAVA